MLSARPRMRALLVDDDPAAVESMAAVLSDELDVATCTSTDDALRKLATREFDVICSDYDMPRMTGIELLERAGELAPDAPCLLVTGSEDYFAHARGGDHYVLIKPYDPERLVALVIQLGRIGQMRRSVRAIRAGGREEPKA